MINRKVFFDNVRKPVFTGTLTTEAVHGCEVILTGWEQRKLTDLRWLAYMLATVRGECGYKMLPVREGFAASDAAARAYVARKGYRYATPVGKHVYYGRGLVQLTWVENYQAMEKLLGITLVDNPDLALEPAIATAIMFEGMIHGKFTNKKLADYFNETSADWVWARLIINGKRKGEPLPDRAEEIAGWARSFHRALVAAADNVVAVKPEVPAAPAAPLPPPPDVPPVVPPEPKGWFASTLDLMRSGRKPS